MNKLKTLYFAGAVAEAIGVGPGTIRMWRDRNVCDFGTVIEGGEDNPRSRRRYDVYEACMMGMALYLNRFGIDLPQAFNLVTGTEAVKSAISTAFFDADEPDCIFCLVDGNGASDNGAGWGNLLFLKFDQWKAHVATAFEAVDLLTKEPAEAILSVNVSAIARRVLKALREVDEG
jgi:hypothetical protein